MEMYNKSHMELSNISILSMVFVMVALYNITPLVIALQIISFAIIIIQKYGTISFRTIDKRYMAWWSLFVAYFGFSYFWGANQKTYVAMMISILQVAVVGFTVLQYADSSEKINKLLNVAIFGCVFLSIRFIIQVPFSAISTGRIGKYLGPEYGNDGAAMVLCYGSLLALIQGMRINRKIILLILPFMVLALLTGTKLCIITFLVGVLCVYLFSSDSTGKKTIFILFVAALLFISLRLLMSVPVFYKTIGYRIESLFDVLTNGVKKKSYYDSSEARYLLIEYGFELFKENPLIGTGLDSYRILTPLSGYYAHNNFIELLVDGGMVGFLLYYWFPLLVILSNIRMLKTNKQLAFPLAIMVAVIVSDIATISFNHEKTQLIFTMMLCLGSDSLAKEKIESQSIPKYKYIR